MVVTIKEVARAAGVSTATVSRVINKATNVLPATIQKVEEAMASLGYQIKDNRRLSINQVDDSIGLIISNFNSPYYGLLAQGVEKIARQYGRTMIVANGQYDADCEEEALNFLLNKGCRNIVMHSKMMSDQTLLKYASHLPGLIIVNRCIKGMESQCVWLKNSHGTYQSTQHLIKQGHRRIAYIGCELELDDKEERLAGYKSALSDAGIPLNRDWLEEVPFGENGGALGAINLLNKGMPVTAVVAFNDYFAAAAIQVFRDHEILVPDQLSVVGFDDVLPQCYFTPKLTTIRSPIESMAMNAARLSIEGSKIDISHEFYPLLVQRDSVAFCHSDSD
ncbi:LacI family transcriptional regulator [Endozoicomonas sp. (ex Bugula neritina AB1)]|nr:LacI family transcriptional regulator [Endozoicomonas sp. (ex Bugula neritina AB1)]